MATPRGREVSRKGDLNYLIKNAAHRLYILTHPYRPDCLKVGQTTTNPAKRLSHYNIGCPDAAYRFAHLVEVSDAKAAEARAHELLADRLHRAEWFRVGIHEAIEVLKKVASEFPPATGSTTPDNTSTE
jgi:hypothetical protein